MRRTSSGTPHSFLVDPRFTYPYIFTNGKHRLVPKTMGRPGLSFNGESKPHTLNAASDMGRDGEDVRPHSIRSSQRLAEARAGLSQ